LSAVLPAQFRVTGAAAAEGVAALPMYDLPELEAANDALWSALAERLRAAGVARTPPILTRGRPLGPLWSDPRLLLAQTCGYPYIVGLRGWVRLVGTPQYRAAGCEGPFHRSAVLVRSGDRAQSLDEMRGRRLALNEATSNTGMNLLRAEIAPLAKSARFFGEVITTGAHARSAAAVAGGEADLCAVDCVTWAHLQRLEPTMASKLRVLAWSSRSPGLPLITGRMTDEATFAALGQCLADVMGDPTLAEVRRALLLDGLHTLPDANYRGLLYVEQIAIDQGYPDLV
jgi:ABC-type phosphate/phosphonate transport system substrate-binding protein